MTPARRPSRRPTVLVVLVTVVLLAGAGVAVAGWQSTTAGTSTGRAGALGTPTNLVPETPTCSNTTARVRVVWNAVPGALSYTVESAAGADFTQGRRTDTAGGRAFTVSTVNATTARTLYIRVIAVAGRWTGAASSTLATTVGPCPG